MSSRLLVSDLQDSRIPSVLNVCPTDERFYQWLNSAQSMMLNQGRWWGSIQETQFCVTDGCLVFPRQVASVEQIAVCGHPIMSESPWFQFTRNLATLRQCGGCSGSTGTSGQCSCGHLQSRARAATVASFATTIGANKLIRSYPGSGDDVGKKIIYQGRDINGVWVRTVIDGVVQDGEQVVLSLPFVDTVTTWGPGSPVAVVKEQTAARVLVFEYDTVAHLERALADYEPGETRPSYRVSFIPGLVGAGGCCGGSCSNGNTTTKTVTAMVKLQHIQLTAPSDWLILQNLEAYQAAMVAVKAREEKDYATFNFEFYGTQASGKNARGPLRVVNRGGAIPLLQAELRTMSSDRVNAYVYGDETDKFARTMLGFR